MEGKIINPKLYSEPEIHQLIIRSVFSDIKTIRKEGFSYIWFDTFRPLEDIMLEIIKMKDLFLSIMDIDLTGIKIEPDEEDQTEFKITITLAS